MAVMQSSAATARWRSTSTQSAHSLSACCPDPGFFIRTGGQGGLVQHGFIVLSIQSIFFLGAQSVRGAERGILGLKVVPNVHLR